MTFLRRLFKRSDDQEPTDLAKHDRWIHRLEQNAYVLQQLNEEPITARVRGHYARRVLPARDPHRSENDL